MALIVEDGSGVVGAESYNSVAELDEYHLKMGNDDWPQPPETGDDPNLAKKEAMARRSTVFLDARYGTLAGGIKTNPDQGLLFPRTGFITALGIEIGPNEIPKEYKNAQAEAALYAYTGLSFYTNVTGGQQLKRKKIDVLEKEWFENSQDTDPEFGWLDLLMQNLFGAIPGASTMTYLRVARA